MNHIGDTNKMVSETPRMKAAVMAAMEHGTGNVYRVGCDIERELNAANDRIKRLIRERDEARAERDEAAKVVEKALSELGQVARSRCALIDRIKRLEEALSRIANQDYRGNRSTESQIAFDALKEGK